MKFGLDELHTALSTQTLHGCSGGMSAAAVIAKLGAPAAIERKRKRRTRLGYSDGLLIAFSQDRLESMHHDLADALPLADIEPLLAPIQTKRRNFDGTQLIEAGCIQLEIVGNSLFAVHLTATGAA
jgi:hypothetical protein